MLTALLALVGVAPAADPGFVYLPASVAVSAVSTSTDVGARANGAIRFVDPGVGRTGVVQRIGGSWAPIPWLAIGAEGMASVGNPEDNPASASGGAWVRVARPDGDHVLVAGQLGSHREFGGVWAVTGIVNVAIPAGAFAFAIAPTVERRIHPDADAVDLSVPLAANVEVAEGWRVGVEAIGQDLEDYLEGEEEEAEGGATWLAAAMVGWRGEHFEAGLAPGVGLAPSGVGFVGRARAAWRF